MTKASFFQIHSPLHLCGFWKLQLFKILKGITYGQQYWHLQIYLLSSFLYIFRNWNVTIANRKENMCREGQINLFGSRRYNSLGQDDCVWGITGSCLGLNQSLFHCAFSRIAFWIGIGIWNWHLTVWDEQGPTVSVGVGYGPFHGSQAVKTGLDMNLTYQFACMHSRN